MCRKGRLRLPRKPSPPFNHQNLLFSGMEKKARPSADVTRQTWRRFSPKQFVLFFIIAIKVDFNHLLHQWIHTALYIYALTQVFIWLMVYRYLKQTPGHLHHFKMLAMKPEPSSHFIKNIDPELPPSVMPLDGCTTTLTGCR